MQNNFNDWTEVMTSTQVTYLNQSQLKNGVTKIRIVGKPSTFYVHFPELLTGGKKRVVCQDNNCILCNKNIRKTQYCQTQIIDKTDGQLKIFEFGLKILEQIKYISKTVNLSETDLEIQKSGYGIDTNYIVKVADHNTPLTQEQRNIITSIEKITVKKPSDSEIYSLGLKDFTQILDFDNDIDGWDTL